MQVSAENTVPKQRGRPFTSGQSGNPAGRPKGARNRSTIAAELLLEGEAQALTRKAIELALAGDTSALRLCLERILPPRKERAIALDLPPIRSVADASAASGAVLAALGEGRITPSEAGDVMELIAACRNNVASASPTAPLIRISFVNPREESGRPD